MLYPAVIRTTAQTVCLSFIVSYGQIFKDCHGRTGSLCRILKYTAYAAVSDKILLLCDISAVYHNAATVNRDRTADDIEHRCLSGAITSYNGNKLSIIYFQIKIIKEAYLVDCSRII